MTIPRGYKPKTRISDSNNNIDKNENKKLTAPTQITTVDEAVKEAAKEVEDAKKKAVVEGSSNIEESSEFKEQPNQHEVTNENKKLNNNIK